MTRETLTKSDKFYEHFRITNKHKNYLTDERKSKSYIPVGINGGGEGGYIDILRELKITSTGIVKFLTGTQRNMLQSDG